MLVVSFGAIFYSLI